MTQATDNQVRVAILTCSIAIWLPIAVAITGLSVTVYGVAQQSLRLMADEQAAALALRTAARLNSGVSPSEAEPTSQVDIATSLDPFVLVFNADRQLLSATATLRSQPPDYPTGVFDTLRTRAQDRVTWQPEAGIRDATVAVPWNGGFVVGGGSLSQTEDTIDRIGLLVIVGWGATLVLVAAAALLVAIRNPHLRSRAEGAPAGPPPPPPSCA